ncbi:MAG: ATP-binding cassette domain-containing protein [Lactobacillus iners]|nr:ATP-binding cassette domain-containing protein [Lactobacillus iners]
MIEYQNVSKKINRKTSLKNGSLNINNGDLLVIVGSNDSCKKIIIRLLNRLIEADEGDIWFNHKKITDYTIKDLRSKISYVSTQANLFNNLNIYQNLTISLDKNISGQDKQTIANTLLELIDMDNQCLNMKPHELTYFEQKKVSLARAFAINPQVVLLDDSFDEMDKISQIKLHELLVRLKKHFHTTILMTTDDIADALKLASSIVIVNGSKIEQVGTARDISQHPANLFVKQLLENNHIGVSFDLETLLKSELGVNPRYYPKTDMLVRYHVYNFKDLVKDCSNHPDSLFIAETDFGEFLIEPKRVWNFLLKRLSTND